MPYLLKILLLAYSVFYQYEVPTFAGVSSLYSSNIWFAPSLTTINEYKVAITASGILPYSFSELTHASLDFTYRIKSNLFLFSGIKTRKLSDIYSENTALLGTAIKIKHFSASVNARGIYQNIGESLFKTTLDISGTYFRSPFILTYSIMNVLTPNLNFKSEEKSKVSQRFLIALNYPQSVYFTFGYEKTQSSESPFISTEVWFTRGFNIVFGIENNGVEGGISLRSKNFGIGIRIKSQTIMGPTYITYLSLHRE